MIGDVLPTVAMCALVLFWPAARAYKRRHHHALGRGIGDRRLER